MSRTPATLKATATAFKPATAAKAAPKLTPAPAPVPAPEPIKLAPEPTPEPTPVAPEPAAPEPAAPEPAATQSLYAEYESAAADMPPSIKTRIVAALQKANHDPYTAPMTPEAAAAAILVIQTLVNAYLAKRSRARISAAARRAAKKAPAIADATPAPVEAAA